MLWPLLARAVLPYLQALACHANITRNLVMYPSTDFASHQSCVASSRSSDVVLSCMAAMGHLYNITL